MSEEKGRGKLELKLLGSPEVRLNRLLWGGVAENHARRSLTMSLSNLICGLPDHF
jgi:hypothetical protein